MKHKIELNRLHDLNACQSGIDFAQRHAFIGLYAEDVIEDSIGDFNGWVNWLATYYVTDTVAPVDEDLLRLPPSDAITTDTDFGTTVKLTRENGVVEWDYDKEGSLIEVRHPGTVTGTSTVWEYISDDRVHLKITKDSIAVYTLLR